MRGSLRVTGSASACRESLGLCSPGNRALRPACTFSGEVEPLADGLRQVAGPTLVRVCAGVS